MWALLVQGLGEHCFLVHGSGGVVLTSTPFRLGRSKIRCPKGTGYLVTGLAFDIIDSCANPCEYPLNSWAPATTDLTDYDGGLESCAFYMDKPQVVLRCLVNGSWGCASTLTELCSTR